MVEVIWQGHACFELRGNDLIIVHDPFGGVPGIPDPKAKADIILCSHSHWDHNNSDAVKKEDSEILEEFAGTKTLKGLEIKGIGTFHDENRKGGRGENSVYVYQLEGLTFCHLGDLGHSFSEKQLEEVNGVDVLFIPVGGVYTIGPKQAVEVVSQIEPKIVIPMHYQTPGLKFQLAPVDDFLKEMGVEVKPVEKLVISRDKLPEEREVVVLKRKK